MMNNLLDVFLTIDKFASYLKEKEFPLSKDGYPIFQKDMFLQQVPEMIVPVMNRKNSRLNKKKTLLVFFCGDIDIYRRLDKLLSEIDEYKEYMGVAGSDITVTADMDIAWQRAILVLNQLIMAVLAVNGIKIVLNTRMGCNATKDLFRYMPQNVMVISGFRGCSRKYREYDFEYIAKIVSLLPRYVLIYGHCHDYVCKHLDMMGISYKVYPSFRELCTEVLYES